MRRIIPLVVLLALVLTGCKVGISADLYVSDIKTVRDQGKPLEADGVIKFQIPSKNVFMEQQAQIKRLLATHFRGVENLRAVEQGMETYVVANIRVPVFRYKKGDLPDRDLISFAVMDFRQEHKLTAVGLWISGKAYQQLNKDVQMQFMGDLNPEDLKITVFLNNDERDPVPINLSSVYLDGRPVPYSADITLKKRDKRELVVSTIATVYSIRESVYIFLQLMEPKGQAG